MEPLTAILAVLAVLLVLGGIVGAFLPVVPGPPLVFLGLWLGAWLGDYDDVSGRVILLLAGITLLAIFLDLVAGALGARRVGASPWALAGAVGGAVVGLFFGLPGIVLGPFFGAVAGELLAKRDLAGAADVGFATWVGILVGALAKVGLSLVMVAVFAVAWLL
ncbi:MAG: DUF456 domain-containing protein [Gemmatimonadales bacterium]|nr:MAG: DUF456 domain-containing protein [Gemmatimonadales bacterium]